jgi:hypothetical protein
MNGDNTVKALDAAGQFIVGVVCAHEADATVCTIETRFRERRDDRISGAASTPAGPFVWELDTTYKAIAYSSGSHDASGIAGVILKGGNDGDTIETLEY